MARKQTAPRRLFARWHGFPAQGETSLPDVDISRMVYLGDLSEVSYLSDKYTGRVAEYVHKFRRTPLVLATPDGRALLVVHREPRHFVTARGLVG